MSYVNPISFVTSDWNNQQLYNVERLGIRNASPSYALDLTSNDGIMARFQGSSAIGNIVSYLNTDTSAFTRWQQSDNISNPKFFSTSYGGTHPTKANVTEIGNFHSGDFKILTGNTERVNFTSTGNVNYTVGAFNVGIATFTVDTNTLYVDSSNDRIGIRKTPNNTLDVLAPNSTSVMGYIQGNNSGSASGFIVSNISTTGYSYLALSDTASSSPATPYYIAGYNGSYSGRPNRMEIVNTRGDLYLYANNGLRLAIEGSGKNMGFNGTSFGSGSGVFFIADATTPPTANPTGGGILYTESGALKFRGSGGTITPIAAA